MSGSAPARAQSNPDPRNSNTSAADAARPFGAASTQVSPYVVPGPDVAAASASAKSSSFQFSQLKTPTYVLVALLATFVVIAPYFMHANWDTLGPIWARIASAVVPGSHTVGDHVITPNVDVIITWQCSGAENMQIFSMLFATVFLMNWKRMQTWRSVLLYVGAMAALFVVNIGRIVTIVVRTKETHYGLANVIALALLIILVWKVKWLRPSSSEPTTPTA
ncbi:MAG TPA: exosortase/archaeosortase family protein [Candidatus Acidoferrum sp.]|nr:exosortase/archaeosortase family protein [Candidatus Acidoferrum sp.]